MAANFNSSGNQSGGAGAAPPLLDRFELKIGRVRGELRTAEARPVFLTFDLDNGFWSKETEVHTDVNPTWAFDARFLYKTEFAHRFHKKFLSVTLSERSPHGDVAWGSGSVSLDSLALGCEKIAVNMIAPDDVTCYGTIRFNLSMVNISEVTALLTELKLSNVSDRFQHDTKLVYFEFSASGFEKGYRHCTERCADNEPKFYSRPALKRDCKLRDMVSLSPNKQGPMRIFFSVHRQVARNRTEQIGLGALPIRMLFSRVSNGYMEAPAKFKVPLQNSQGILKGKILLRNIPRFHQLPGDDLINVNGVITPVGVDLEQRKIVPWMKLPKPLVPSSNNSNSSPAKDIVAEQQQKSIDLQQQQIIPVREIITKSVSSSPIDDHSNSPYDVSDGMSKLNLDNGAVRFDNYSNGYAQPNSNGFAQPSSGGFAQPNSNGFAQPNSGGFVQPNSNGYTQPNSNGFAQPNSNGYAQPNSNGYTQPNSNGYGQPASNCGSTVAALHATKSAKSLASYSTFEGGVEVGSVLNSVTSDEGTEGVYVAGVSSADTEWVPVEDTASGLFYFASKVTNESLWLPPEWEREVDSASGRYVFVDYASGTKRHHFPADEARRYREAVFSQQ